MSDEIQSDIPAEPGQDAGGLTEEQLASLDALSPENAPEAVAEKEQRGADTVVMVSMLVTGVFEVLATRLGEHWRLDASEVQAIATPAVAVMNKYLPEFDSGPELALAASVGMVVLPRVLASKEGGTGGDQSEPESR